MSFNSSLFDETTFYHQFIEDLKVAQSEVIIESPFITSKRLNILYPTLLNLVSRGVKVFIITRLPKLHQGRMQLQAEAAIKQFEQLGIQVFVTSNKPHRKLAILDRQVLWEGSLNILSYSHSREIMRRIYGHQQAIDMFKFLKLSRFIY